eukprot:CAMPEP_0197195968 /NCGR_PEP_ID=MMETSP1423-20130617/32103_1 /TAXON_ID=476441 /ORGANISM="Pseudo-nitzschia heimii, Strain UNC1101" /LENGTH=267 /DNA_ID=CAMNT_0042649731 /DNA_START=152 /DNA_END=956 /DNA_ORIENTATION=+
MARTQPSSKLSILGICLLVAFLAASADAASLRGTKVAAVVDENAEDSEDFYQAIVDEPFEDAPEDEQLDEERKLHRTNIWHNHVQDATRNSYFISSNRAPYSNWDPWYNNGPVRANDAPEDEQLDEERKLHGTNIPHNHVQEQFWRGGGGGGSQDATRNSYFISSNRAPYSNWDPWYNNGPVRANYVGVGANVYERAFYGGPRQQRQYEPGIIRRPAVNSNVRVDPMYSYGSVRNPRVGNTRVGNPRVGVNSMGNFVQGSVNYLASF